MHFLTSWWVGAGWCCTHNLYGWHRLASKHLPATCNVAPFEIYQLQWHKFYFKVEISVSCLRCTFQVVGACLQTSHHLHSSIHSSSMHVMLDNGNLQLRGGFQWSNICCFVTSFTSSKHSRTSQEVYIFSWRKVVVGGLLTGCFHRLYWFTHRVPHKSLDTCTHSYEWTSVSKLWLVLYLLIGAYLSTSSCSLLGWPQWIICHHLIMFSSVTPTLALYP